jgi:transcriptional regulator with XRE-family HTH domain
MDIKIKLQECLDDLGLSHEQAAKKLGKETQWIGRRVRGERKLTVPDLLLLCGKLNVTADSIVDIPLKGVDKANADPVLIDTVVAFVMEACNKSKVNASKRQRGEWATLVFTAALELRLNVFQTKGLAKLLVKSGSKK